MKIRIYNCSNYEHFTVQYLNKHIHISNEIQTR